MCEAVLAVQYTMSRGCANSGGVWRATESGGPAAPARVAGPPSKMTASSIFDSGVAMRWRRLRGHFSGTVAPPGFARQAAEGDDENLARVEEGQALQDAGREAVRVQADSQLVDAEPRPGRHDPAGDGQHGQAFGL